MSNHYSIKGKTIEKRGPPERISRTEGPQSPRTVQLRRRASFGRKENPPVTFLHRVLPSSHDGLSRSISMRELRMERVVSTDPRDKNVRRTGVQALLNLGPHTNLAMDEIF